MPSRSSKPKEPVYRVPFTTEQDGLPREAVYYTTDPDSAQFAAIGVEADRGGHKIWAIGVDANEAYDLGAATKKAHEATNFALSRVYIVARSGEPTLVESK